MNVPGDTSRAKKRWGQVGHYFFKSVQKYVWTEKQRIHQKVILCIYYVYFLVLVCSKRWIKIANCTEPYCAIYQADCIEGKSVSVTHQSIFLDVQQDYFSSCLPQLSKALSCFTGSCVKFEKFPQAMSHQSDDGWG